MPHTKQASSSDSLDEDNSSNAASKIFVVGRRTQAEHAEVSKTFVVGRRTQAEHAEVSKTFVAGRHTRAEHAEDSEGPWLLSGAIEN